MQYVTRKNVKKVVVLVTAVSADYAITSLIYQAVTVEKKRHKVQLAIGAVVIGMFVGDKIGDFVEAKMDELFESFDEALKKREEAVQE